MKRLMQGLAAAVVLAASTQVAGAQILVAGTTSGCFYGALSGNTTNCTATAGAHVDGLVFTDGTFSGTTNQNGEVSIGTVAGLNFGTFTAGSTFDFGPLLAPPGNFFNLFIAFTQPDNGNGTVTAGITGSVEAGNDGSLRVNFDNTGFYVDGVGTVYVNDLSVGAGGSNIISGDVIVSPEPATLALLATGLVGVAGVARRRRKSA